MIIESNYMVMEDIPMFLRMVVNNCTYLDFVRSKKVQLIIII